jgi:glycosyltransferase involved in cell wall biosynthesis
MSELVKHFPFAEQKTTVIYNFVDRENFKHSDENPYPDEKYILYVGNIKPHKNLVRLVQAFNQLKASGIKLVIVGDRDGLINGIKGFDQLIANNKNIIFTGRISDERLISLYSYAQFLAFPSLYEGMGAPPLEAMSCGTPVLASSIKVVKEICRDGALYCDPLNIDDISEKMSRLIESPELRSEYIQKGENLCSQYSQIEFTKKHLEIFNGQN